MLLSHLFESVETANWTMTPGRRAAVARGDEVVVWVDVAKIEAGWQTDRNFYVGPGGTANAIGKRYDRFGAWVMGGEPVEMSEIGFDGDKARPFFTNGRHRFAWFRDHGAEAVPVVTPTDRAGEFEKMFGSNLRKTTFRTE